MEGSESYIPSCEREDPEVTENGNQNINRDGEDFGLPWHHVQLYRLYGNEADYFLYPKLSTEKVKGLQSTSNKTAKVSGASSLWTKLRSESHCKLTAKQVKLPSQLQSSYRSFVREFVTTERSKGRKDIYSSNDVPDLHKLVDQTVHDRILERQQTTQVMWRASRKNEDNTTILIHNSPLHHLSNGSGIGSVQQYLCQSQDRSEVLYDSISDSGEFNAALQPKCNEVVQEKPGSKVKLIYVTGLDKVSSGEFSRKHAESQEAHQMLRNLTDSFGSYGKEKEVSGTPASRTKPRTTYDLKLLDMDFRSQHQPLTLATLLDYKLPLSSQSQKYSRHQYCF